MLSLATQTKYMKTERYRHANGIRSREKGHAGQVEGEQLARNTGVEGLKSDSTVNRLSTNNKVSSSGRIYHLHKAESTLSGRDQALGVARSMVQPGSRLEMWKGL